MPRARCRYVAAVDAIDFLIDAIRHYDATIATIMVTPDVPCYMLMLRYAY